MSLYLYLSRIVFAARFLGMASLSLAMVGFASYFVGIDGTAYQLIWASFGFSLVGAFLVEYKRARAALILTVPFSVLALTFIVSLNRVVLFGTLAFEVGLIDAWLLGRMDSTDSARIRREEHLGALLAPFLLVGGSIRQNIFRGRTSSLLSFLSYCPLSIASVVFAVALWTFAGEMIADAFIIAIGLYFAIATNKLIRPVH